MVQRFEFTFQCPEDRNFELGSSAFFELVPSHTNYAQIQTESGDFVEQLITRDRQVLDLKEVAGRELEGAGFFTYVGLGIWHIFTGVDHQAFLVGLILLSRRSKDLVFVITGFTIGHSLTLALAVTGIVRPARRVYRCPYWLDDRAGGQRDRGGRDGQARVHRHRLEWLSWRRWPWERRWGLAGFRRRSCWERVWPPHAT